MNQLDLWRGGAQINRGYKYIVNNKYNSRDIKMICVICNDVDIKSKNKIYEIFNIGFRDKTLTYIKI